LKQYTRKEMQAIMEVRGFSPNTVKIYVDHIKKFAGYFNKPPHLMTPEHIHTYQVYLVQEKHLSWSSFNQAVCALRFFLISLLAMTGPSSTFHFRKNTISCQSFYPKKKYLLYFQ